MFRTFAIAVILVILLAGCAKDPLSGYVGLWETEGKEGPEIMEIARDGDTFTATERYPTQSKPLVLTKQEGQLAAGAFPLGLVADGRRLMVADKIYDTISASRLAELQAEAAKVAAEAAQWHARYVGLWEQQGEYPTHMDRPVIEIAREGDTYVKYERTGIWKSPKGSPLTSQGKQLGPWTLADDAETITAPAMTGGTLTFRRISSARWDEIQASHKQREMQQAEKAAQQATVLAEQQVQLKAKQAENAKNQTACSALKSEYRGKRDEFKQSRMHERMKQEGALSGPKASRIRDEFAASRRALDAEYGEKAKAIPGCSL